MTFIRAVFTALVCALAISACSPRAPDVHAVPEADKDWPFYGANQEGQRYSAAGQITPQNVAALKAVWSFSTSDLTSKGKEIKHAAFEATPIMVEGKLFLCSPFNEVFALDPETGKKIWSYDSKIDPKVRYPNSNTCRGVSFWRDPAAANEAVCAARIFAATNDRRLIALDAGTGKPCEDFGKAGVVDVGAGVPLHRPGEMQITSAPIAARGMVVVGSSIDDNQFIKQVSGAVRAYDARTGEQKWIWDPLATAGKDVIAGAANAWAPMSFDEARGLVYVPTGSASPDFWGGMRKGEAGDADSVVALDIKTGKRVWAFKTVHHDVWDYDNPAQPTLAEIEWNGVKQPAVLQATKQGLLFTLNRETGAPVIPVQERPVPQGGVEGEMLSPTQPFPTAPAPLAPNTISEKDAYGLTPFDRGECRDKIKAARNEGLFTPPSEQGTIVYPFTGGGVNWGGIAFDPARQVVYVNTSSVMHLITMIPAAKVKAAKEAEPDVEISPQEGAPFGMRREVLRSSMIGLPCNPPPWGSLSAVDMKTGKILWRVPFGTTQDLAPGSQLLLHDVGAPNFGGPMTTASGLVFIGASLDNYLRAFDAANGKELWRGRLPAGGQATPMTYVWKGRQYVVIAAGGHAKSDTKRGDQLIAFALPE